MSRNLASERKHWLLRLLFALLFLFPAPRLAVHSHADVVQNSGYAVLASHLKLYHCDDPSCVDFGQPHVHLAFSLVPSELPSTSAAVRLVPSAPDARPEILDTTDIATMSLQLLSACSSECQEELGHPLSDAGSLTAPKRVLYCVWNC